MRKTKIPEAARLAEWEHHIRAMVPLEELWLVRCFEEVDSTMESARALIPTSVAQGFSPVLALTRIQKRGRGRQGRNWQASREGFYATYAFVSARPLEEFSGFSLVVGTVLVKVLESLGAKVGMKWPNDILTADGKKLAGILIELVAHKETTAVLIGIGVNLQGVPSNEPSAIALETLIHAHKISPVQFAALLSMPLYSAWKRFLANGFAPFRNEWMQHAFFIGEPLTVDTGDTTVHGICRGVSTQGLLLLERQGETIELVSGHVVR